MAAILLPPGRTGIAGLALTAGASLGGSVVPAVAWEPDLAGRVGTWGLGLSGIVGGWRFSVGEIDWGCLCGRGGIPGLEGTSGLFNSSFAGSILVTSW